MNVLPARLARLYYWLGDALFWQDRYDEMVALGEEGLRLFGKGESVEAALMHSTISWGLFVSSSAGSMATRLLSGRCLATSALLRGASPCVPSRRHLLSAGM